MDSKWIAALCIAVFLVSCYTTDDSPMDPADDSFSSPSSLVEVSSSSMASSSSATSSSSLRILPPAKIEEDTLRGISADSVRALLRLPATPPAHVQALMHLWDSLAPSYIDTLLSPSLDSSWMLRESVDQDWCTFEEGLYDVYTSRKESYSIYNLDTPDITSSTEVYAGDKLVYTSDSYIYKTMLDTNTTWSCHSFGLPIKPFGGCYGDDVPGAGVNVALPDGSHLEAMKVFGVGEGWYPAYIWAPGEFWQHNCPVTQ